MLRDVAEVASQSHNLEVIGSSPIPATNPKEQPIKFSDLPTKERFAHAKREGGIEIKLNPPTGQEVSRVSITTPIEYYAHHDYIEPHQLEAAQRLEDGYLANRSYTREISPSPRMRSCLNMERGKSLTDDEEAAALKEAAQSYYVCIKLFTSIQRSRLISIIAPDYTANIAGEMARRGLLIPAVISDLRDQLDKVAKHYGIKWHNDRY